MRLQEMTGAQFERFLAWLIPEYAREGGRATNTPPDKALEIARDQIEKLLPEGRETPGQFVRNVVADSGEVAGYVWYAIRPGQLFIYDLHIEESARGQGLGSAAMLALEEEARRHSADELKLAVFSHNTGAVRLYERLGYAASRVGEGGMQMTKRL